MDFVYHNANSNKVNFDSFGSKWLLFDFAYQVEIAKVILIPEKVVDGYKMFRRSGKNTRKTYKCCWSIMRIIVKQIISIDKYLILISNPGNNRPAIISKRGIDKVFQTSQHVAFVRTLSTIRVHVIYNQTKNWPF